MSTPCLCSTADHIIRSKKTETIKKIIFDTFQVVNSTFFFLKNGVNSTLIMSLSEWAYRPFFEALHPDQERPFQFWTSVLHQQFSTQQNRGANRTCATIICSVWLSQTRDKVRVLMFYMLPGQLMATTSLSRAKKKKLPCFDSCFL